MGNLGGILETARRSLLGGAGLTVGLTLLAIKLAVLIGGLRAEKTLVRCQLA